MSYTVGDGMVALALAAGLVGYFYITHRSKQLRLEAIHQERLAAMDKGIPLPEFPMDPDGGRKADDTPVLPILGVVLLTLSLGTMAAFYLAFPPPEYWRYWVAPLPTAFLGAGLIAFHFLNDRPGR